MTFLAAVTTGGVAMVIGAASEWQSDIAREMTIQVRPTPGNDIDAQVLKAESIARATAGMGEVRTYTKAESERLLEPWLGGLSLDELPVPRMIAVRVAPGAQVDAAALRQALATQVAGASLDDHRGWIDRMRRMAAAAVAGGLGIVGLVLAATILSVAFATRGAMASNRPIVEVLHFVGAKEAYIASQFQRHFLTLGLKGGVIGGITAIRFSRSRGRSATCSWDRRRGPGHRAVRLVLDRALGLCDGRRRNHPHRAHHGDHVAPCSASHFANHLLMARRLPCADLCATMLSG